MSSTKKRRTRIPDRPSCPSNLWTVLRNCAGKDLSKIPLPVNFSEPLSLLQRLTEDYEYSELLDLAKKCTDPCEQIAYVAAFSISAYSTTVLRTGKPFNPLLGETYECDRMADLGWKSISEQVCHHPPITALYCEGKGWKSRQEFTMISKFTGKYLQITPKGYSHLLFDAGQKYKWNKAITVIHNIAMGKLWIDQQGEVVITGKCKAAGVKCYLKYVPYSYFGKETEKRVKGVVVDADGAVKWTIDGTWDSQIVLSPVVGSPPRSGSSVSIYDTDGNSIVVWERRLPPPDAEKYYGFTVLAAQLNEPEDGVAPTDSRNRPDQKLMEEGKWEEANKEKVRLEEKQRQAANRREEEAQKKGIAEEYRPAWFEPKKDEEHPGEIIHVYKGDYWQCKQKQKWDRCPDIF